ncbi:MAG: thermonuclease family protein [Deltaproteobacteria bacterium]|nr:thermonuclease family protein [Deltaproteobacteria bacterium]
MVLRSHRADLRTGSAWEGTRRGTLILAICVALGAGCALRTNSHTARQRYEKKELQSLLTRFEQPGLVLGEFALASKPVIDGDTVKVAGLETTLRLLAIDTEETFKNEDDRRFAAADWEGYLAFKASQSRKPIKVATPMGEEAKRFAQKFFQGVTKVRLERDHPKDLRGRFNRYLVYVFAMKDGVWVNYNIACVRAGMSPYFTKYGYSRRFHADFLRAQELARSEARGIWDPNTQHYPDYDARLEWWNARGEFVAGFEDEGRDKEDWVVLTHWDSLLRLEELEGRDVHVLGTVSEVKLGDRGPTKVLLGRRMFSDFPLIFFDKDVFGSSRIADYRGEFVHVKGQVTRYRNKHNGEETLQIQVKSPSQILLSVRPPPASPSNTATASTP